MSKRIGIDCRMWDESGIGRYLRNLVLNLSKEDSENTYFLFFLKKNKNIKLPDNFIEVEANFGWYGAVEQIRFPKLLNSYNLDLVHFPHFNVPIFYRGRYIVTIHDLIHQHFSTKKTTTLSPVFYRIKRVGYNRVFHQAILKSEKILTPSNFVKNQLIDEWDVDSKKISVTYEGVDEEILEFVKKDSDKNFKFIKEKFKINGRFLFFIGNAHPHKNVTRLIRVFKKINEKYPELQLVLSGKRNYFWDDTLRFAKNDKNIIYTDYVNDEELVSLYKNAEVFVMTSLEEGFGIPILEAMACGCPVVSSDKGSLREIGNDAVLYFDPLNDNDIEEKIIKILEDKKYKEELIKKGEKRVREFSWKKMAQQTLEIYKQ